MEVCTRNDQYDVVDAVDGWDAIDLHPIMTFSTTTNADTTIEMTEIAKRALSNMRSRCLEIQSNPANFCAGLIVDTLGNNLQASGVKGSII